MYLYSESPTKHSTDSKYDFSNLKPQLTSYIQSDYDEEKIVKLLDSFSPELSLLKLVTPL